METSFCVIKFCDYESKPSKYVYVPKSWVKTRRDADNMVGVAYPAEDPRTTEKRIMNNEEPSDDWEEHYCELLYTNNSKYGDAKLEAMHLNYIDKKEKPAAVIKGKRKSSTIPTSDAPPSKTKVIDKKLYINPIKRDVFTITKDEEESQKPTKQSSDLGKGDGIDELLTFLEQLKTNIMEKITIFKSNTPKAQNSEPPLLKIKKGTEEPPPEFNENDTSWTLKYRNSGSGLQELMPGSGIYIRKDQVVHLAEADNYEELIQILMINIFNDNALSYCTLERTNRRLHQRAVNVLLNYITSVGHVKGWDEINIIELKNVMRHILQVKKIKLNIRKVKTTEALYRV